MQFWSSATTLLHLCSIVHPLKRYGRQVTVPRNILDLVKELASRRLASCPPSGCSINTTPFPPCSTPDCKIRTPTSSVFPLTKNNISQFPPEACNGARIRHGLYLNRHPYHCALYLHCQIFGDSFRPYPRSCAPGTFWNMDTLTCDYPGLVNCPIDRCQGMVNVYREREDSCRMFWVCQNNRTVSLRSCYDLSRNPLVADELRGCIGHPTCQNHPVPAENMAFFPPCYLAERDCSSSNLVLNKAICQCVQLKP